MPTRDSFHRLIDELPESELAAAQRFLHYLGATADPVLRALLEAPVDDEPEPGDVPPGEPSIEARASRLVIDITAPGTLRVGRMRGHPLSGSHGATPAHRVRSTWTRPRLTPRGLP